MTAFGRSPTNLERVEEFTQAFGLPVYSPRWNLETKQHHLRLLLSLILEETHELIEANFTDVVNDETRFVHEGLGNIIKFFRDLPLHYFRPNHVESLDALADLLYVTYGMAHRMDYPIDPAFKEVHRSNMAKLVDGKVLKDAKGKVQKPEGWTPPDLASILANHAYNKGKT